MKDKPTIRKCSRCGQVEAHGKNQYACLLCTRLLSKQYRNQTKTGVGRGGRAERIDWLIWDNKIGTMTDHSLALLIGCASRTIQARKARLGIAKYKIPSSPSKTARVRGAWLAKRIPIKCYCGKEFVEMPEGHVGRAFRFCSRKCAEYVHIADMIGTPEPLIIYKAAVLLSNRLAEELTHGTKRRKNRHPRI